MSEPGNVLFFFSFCRLFVVCLLSRPEVIILIIIWIIKRSRFWLWCDGGRKETVTKQSNCPPVAWDVAATLSIQKIGLNIYCQRDIQCFLFSFVCLFVRVRLIKPATSGRTADSSSTKAWSRREKIKRSQIFRSWRNIVYIYMKHIFLLGNLVH